MCNSLLNALQTQDLLTQFSNLKQKLNSLHTIGTSLIQRTSNQAEKQDVQLTISNINKRCQCFQALLSNRARELSEADILNQTIGRISGVVIKWLDQADTFIGSELGYCDIATVKKQLKVYQV